MNTPRHYAITGAALAALAIVVIRSAYGRADLIHSGRIYITGVFALAVAIGLIVHAYEIHDDQRNKSRSNHPTNHEKEKN